jgi:hypothetical protein
MNSITALANRSITALFAADDPILPPNVQDVLDKSSASYSVVQRVFIFIGFVVLIWTSKKVVFALIGKAGPAEALKSGVLGITAAIFCFNLKLPLSLVNGLAGVWGKIFQSIGGVLG